MTRHNEVRTRIPRSLVVAASVLIVGSALSACTPATANSNPTSSQDSTSATESTAATTPEPTPVETSNPTVLNITANTTITDRDGYTFDFAIDVGFEDLTQDMTNDKPGFVSAHYQIARATGSVANTTTGRKAFAGFADSVVVAALYPANSMACKGTKSVFSDMIELAGSCGHYLVVSGTESNALNLEESQSLTLDFHTANAIGSGLDDQTLSFTRIPENEWAATVAAIEKPQAILVLGTGYATRASREYPGLCTVNFGPGAISGSDAPVIASTGSVPGCTR